VTRELLDILTEPFWSALALMIMPIALAVAGRRRYRRNAQRRWHPLPLFRVVFLWPFAAGSMCFCAVFLSAWNQAAYLSGPWLSGRPDSALGRLVLQLLIMGIYLRAQYEIYALGLETLECSFGDHKADRAEESP
jgi:hypothetical protein